MRSFFCFVWEHLITLHCIFIYNTIVQDSYYCMPERKKVEHTNIFKYVVWTTRKKWGWYDENLLDCLDPFFFFFFRFILSSLTRWNYLLHKSTTKKCFIFLKHFFFCWCGVISRYIALLTFFLKKNQRNPVFTSQVNYHREQNTTQKTASEIIISMSALAVFFFFFFSIPVRLFFHVH